MDLSTLLNIKPYFQPITVIINHLSIVCYNGDPTHIESSIIIYVYWIELYNSEYILLIYNRWYLVSEIINSLLKYKLHCKWEHANSNKNRKWIKLDCILRDSRRVSPFKAE